MKLSKLYAAPFLAVVCCVGSAQQPATAPSPAAGPSPANVSPANTIPADQQPSRADVIKMMDAMHIRSQLESMTRTMNQQMKQQMNEALKNQPNMTPQQIADFESSYDKGASVYPISEMMDDMIPVYQRHMNKSDIDAIVTFYSSPAGQHLLAEGPAIMKDSMGVLIPKVQARMQAYREKLKKDIESAPKAAPAPAPASTPAPNH